MFVYYNPNPQKKLEEDCVVRAICKAFDWDWDIAYSKLCAYGYKVKSMPSLNHVWGGFLKENGYERNIIPNTCPDCYTIENFERGHHQGIYLVATGSHVVTIKDGNHYDTWDSGGEVALYYYQKKGEQQNETNSDARI